MLQQVIFQESVKKIQRTHVLEGKVTFAEDYTTEKGSIPGVAIQLEGVPYKIRILQNSIKGGSTAGTLLGCTVSLTGIMVEYNGSEYFNPKDCTVTYQSGLARLVAAAGKKGLSYAGSLD